MALILVVDDEAPIVELVAKILEKKGHSVVSAASADEALAVLDRSRPELALVDLVMPGKGGMTLIMENLRARPGLRVIAMSGRIPLGTEGFAGFSAQFGIDCMLNKPFTPQELEASVEKALAKRCG